VALAAAWRIATGRPGVDELALGVVRPVHVHRGRDHRRPGSLRRQQRRRFPLLWALVTISGAVLALAGARLVRTSAPSPRPRLERVTCGTSWLWHSSSPPACTCPDWSTPDGGADERGVPRRPGGRDRDRPTAFRRGSSRSLARRSGSPEWTGYDRRDSCHEQRRRPESFRFATEIWQAAMERKPS
jgi:hypothetical protein